MALFKEKSTENNIETLYEAMEMGGNGILDYLAFSVKFNLVIKREKLKKLYSRYLKQKKENYSDGEDQF